jgi:hypothetical protein
LRLQNESFQARRHLGRLRAEAFSLALRFGQEGEGPAAKELGAALKEVMLACEALHRHRIALERRSHEIRGLEPGSPSEVQALRWARQERAEWLCFMNTHLLATAAARHREAENARRKQNPFARRLFMIKNRFEAVARAIGEIAALDDHDLTPRRRADSTRGTPR